MYAVPWQHCCSGELYDWQTTDHRIGAHAISFAGLCRPGTAALAKFVTGEQQRSKLGWWTEFGWRTELRGWTELGRPGSAGTGARASFGRIPLGLPASGSPTTVAPGSAGIRARAPFGWIPLRLSAAGSPTAVAAGRPAAPSTVRRQPGTALGVTSNGAASNGAGSGASRATDGRICDSSRSW